MLSLINFISAIYQQNCEGRDIKIGIFGENPASPTYCQNVCASAGDFSVLNIDGPALTTCKDYLYLHFHLDGTTADDFMRNYLSIVYLGIAEVNPINYYYSAVTQGIIQKKDDSTITVFIPAKEFVHKNLLRVDFDFKRGGDPRLTTAFVYLESKEFSSYP